MDDSPGGDVMPEQFEAYESPDESPLEGEPEEGPQTELTTNDEAPQPAPVPIMTRDRHNTASLHSAVSEDHVDVEPAADEVNTPAPSANGPAAMQGDYSSKSAADAGAGAVAFAEVGDDSLQSATEEAYDALSGIDAQILELQAALPTAQVGPGEALRSVQVLVNRVANLTDKLNAVSPMAVSFDAHLRQQIDLAKRELRNIMVAINSRRVEAERQLSEADNGTCSDAQQEQACEPEAVKVFSETFGSAQSTNQHQLPVTSSATGETQSAQVDELEARDQQEEDEEDRTTQVGEPSTPGTPVEIATDVWTNVAFRLGPRGKGDLKNLKLPLPRTWFAGPNAERELVSPLCFGSLLPTICPGAPSQWKGGVPFLWHPARGSFAPPRGFDSGLLDAAATEQGAPLQLYLQGEGEENSPAALGLGLRDLPRAVSPAEMQASYGKEEAATFERVADLPTAGKNATGQVDTLLWPSEGDALLPHAHDEDDERITVRVATRLAQGEGPLVNYEISIPKPWLRDAGPPENGSSVGEELVSQHKLGGLLQSHWPDAPSAWRAVPHYWSETRQCFVLEEPYDLSSMGRVPQFYLLGKWEPDSKSPRTSRLHVSNLPAPLIPPCIPELDITHSSRNTTPPPPADWAALLTRFYSLHNPEKLANVPGLLKKYPNGEEHLWRLLLEKYNLTESNWDAPQPRAVPASQRRLSSQADLVSGDPPAAASPHAHTPVRGQGDMNGSHQRGARGIELPVQARGSPPSRSPPRTPLQQRTHGGSQATPPPSHQKWESLILGFYRRHNPDKVKRVPKLLAQFRGNEENLWAALHNKYGLPLDEPPPLSPREIDQSRTPAEGKTGYTGGHPGPFAASGTDATQQSVGSPPRGRGDAHLQRVLQGGSPTAFKPAAKVGARSCSTGSSAKQQSGQSSPARSPQRAQAAQQLASEEEELINRQIEELQRKKHQLLEQKRQQHALGLALNEALAQSGAQPPPPRGQQQQQQPAASPPRAEQNHYPYAASDERPARSPSQPSHQTPDTREAEPVQQAGYFDVLPVAHHESLPSTEPLKVPLGLGFRATPVVPVAAALNTAKAANPGTRGRKPVGAGAAYTPSAKRRGSLSSTTPVGSAPRTFTAAVGKSPRSITPRRAASNTALSGVSGRPNPSGAKPVAEQPAHSTGVPRSRTPKRALAHQSVNATSTQAAPQQAPKWGVGPVLTKAQKPLRSMGTPGGKVPNWNNVKPKTEVGVRKQNARMETQQATGGLHQDDAVAPPNVGMAQHAASPEAGQKAAAGGAGAPRVSTSMTTLSSSPQESTDGVPNPLSPQHHEASRDSPSTSPLRTNSVPALDFKSFNQQQQQQLLPAPDRDLVPPAVLATEALLRQAANKQKEAAATKQLAQGDLSASAELSTSPEPPQEKQPPTAKSPPADVSVDPHYVQNQQMRNVAEYQQHLRQQQQPGAEACQPADEAAAPAAARKSFSRRSVKPSAPVQPRSRSSGSTAKRRNSATPSVEPPTGRRQLYQAPRPRSRTPNRSDSSLVEREGNWKSATVGCANTAPLTAMERFEMELRQKGFEQEVHLERAEQMRKAESKAMRILEKQRHEAELRHQRLEVKLEREEELQKKRELIRFQREHRTRVSRDWQQKRRPTISPTTSHRQSLYEYSNYRQDDFGDLSRVLNAEYSSVAEVGQSHMWKPADNSVHDTALQPAHQHRQLMQAGAGNNFHTFASASPQPMLQLSDDYDAL
ncbi:hypothetical protein DIPPA_00831 [Diplonema papillatum]|nr:hypothetical protein DIPPA_00831 [Diplonema papillatum]